MNPGLILAAGGSEDGLILLHQVLVHLGHSVVLAGSSDELVSQAARHRPDAIVLDLQMEGEDLGDTLRALATKGWAATTPVIALSELAQLSVSATRFATVVPKPIVLPTLAAAIEGCLTPGAIPTDPRGAAADEISLAFVGG